MNKVQRLLTLGLIFFISVSKSQNWTPVQPANNPYLDTGLIYTMCIDKNGDIYAGGDFRLNGHNCIAKFDGNKWTEVGNFIDTSSYYRVHVLCLDNQGNLYASGSFKNNNGHYYVAKFDGIQWSEVGGFDNLAADDIITSLCCDSFGNLFASGNFKNTSGDYYVAKFDGNTWTQLGGTGAFVFNSFISSISCDKLGNIYAGGSFKNQLNMRFIAKFDGTSWSELGNTPSFIGNTGINAMCIDSNNNVYVAGRTVSKFDGTNWTELGGANSLNASSWISLITCNNNGNVFVSGDFMALGVTFRQEVYTFDGNNWSVLGGNKGVGLKDSRVYTMCNDLNGNVYVGSTFYPNGAFAPSFIAKFTNNQWNPVRGFKYIATDQPSLFIDNNGNLYSSYLTNSNNLTFPIFKYDGVTWKELGGMNSFFTQYYSESFCEDSIGNLILTGHIGYSNIHFTAKYDGTSWTHIASPTNSTTSGIICFNNNLGDIFGLGSFLDSNNKSYNLLKLNGTNWNKVTLSNQAQTYGYLYSPCADSAGHIYAASANLNSQGLGFVAKFDGNNWNELGGNNSLNAKVIGPICCDRSGNVYATTNDSVHAVVRYNGIGWQTISDNRFSSFFNQANFFKAIALDANGDVYVIGSFQDADNRTYVLKFRNHNWVKLGTLNTDNITGLVTYNNNIYITASDRDGSYQVYKYDYQCPSVTPIVDIYDTINCGTYTANGRTYTTSGTYTDTITTWKGCDSIVKMHLTFTSNPIITTLYISQFDSFQFKHQWITSSGLYYDTLSSYVGCDSIVILDLTIRKMTYIFVFDTVCMGSIYSYKGHAIYCSSVGNIDTSFYRTDSIIYFHLFAIPHPYSYFVVQPDPNTPHNWLAVNYSFDSIPKSYLWYWGDGTTSGGTNPSHTYSSPGYYTICLTLTSYTGCSSTYCDSSLYLYKISSANSMVTINVINSLPSGIHDFTPTNSTLYAVPNPSEGTFAIVGLENENASINILGYDGRVLKTYTAKKNQLYTIDELSAGIYFVQIIAPNKGVKTIKLEKQ